jgi:hypothetical protein
MEFGELYNFVIVCVLIGVVLAVGVLLLDKLGATSGLTKTAQTALNNTRDSITPIASTWLPLIVTFAVLALILGLVVRGFVNKR